MRLQRNGRGVDQQPRRRRLRRRTAARLTSGTLNSVVPSGFSSRAARSASTNCRVEDVQQPAADGVGARDAVERLERVVPADDLLVVVEHDQAVVERFEDVLVELAHPAELLGLEVKLAIQAAVLDRGRDLPGDRRQQREVLAVERLVGFLPSEREHGDRRALEDARARSSRCPDRARTRLPRPRTAPPQSGSSSATVWPVSSRGTNDEDRAQARHRLGEAEVADRPESRRAVRRPASAPCGRRPAFRRCASTSRWLRRTTSRSLFRSRAKPTSARR